MFKKRVVGLTTYRPLTDEELDMNIDASPVIDFTISKRTLKKYLRKEGGVSFKEFMDSWTWDDAEWIYWNAKAEGLILSEKEGVNDLHELLGV